MKTADNALKILLTTHDDLLQAQDLAKQLVTNRIAACVNLIPNVTSVFHWDDDVRMEQEIIMLIKTTENHVNAVKAFIETEHGYDVPELVELDGTVLHQPYMDWINGCLGND